MNGNGYNFPPKRSASTEKRIPHYYGDIARRLLIVAGVVMLVLTPFFADRLPGPLILSVFVPLIMIFVAALIDPHHIGLPAFASVLSAAGLVIFEMYAISTYRAEQSFSDPFFLASQALVVIFLFALYYSMKTLRGMMVADKPGESDKRT